MEEDLTIPEPLLEPNLVAQATPIYQNFLDAYNQDSEKLGILGIGITLATDKLAEQPDAPVFQADITESAQPDFWAYFLQSQELWIAPNTGLEVNETNHALLGQLFNFPTEPATQQPEPPLYLSSPAHLTYLEDYDRWQLTSKGEVQYLEPEVKVAISKISAEPTVAENAPTIPVAPAGETAAKTVEASAPTEPGDQQISAEDKALLEKVEAALANEVQQSESGSEQLDEVATAEREELKETLFNQIQQSIQGALEDKGFDKDYKATIKFGRTNICENGKLTDKADLENLTCILNAILEPDGGHVKTLRISIIEDGRRQEIFAIKDGRCTNNLLGLALSEEQSAAKQQKPSQQKVTGQQTPTKKAGKQKPVENKTVEQQAVVSSAIAQPPAAQPPVEQPAVEQQVIEQEATVEQPLEPVQPVTSDASQVPIVEERQYPQFVVQDLVEATVDTQIELPIEQTVLRSTAEVPTLNEPQLEATIQAIGESASAPVQPESQSIPRHQVPGNETEAAQWRQNLSDVIQQGIQELVEQQGLGRDSTATTEIKSLGLGDATVLETDRSVPVRPAPTSETDIRVDALQAEVNQLQSILKSWQTHLQGVEAKISALQHTASHHIPTVVDDRLREWQAGLYSKVIEKAEEIKAPIQEQVKTTRFSLKGALGRLATAVKESAQEKLQVVQESVKDTIASAAVGSLSYVSRKVTEILGETLPDGRKVLEGKTQQFTIFGDHFKSTSRQTYDRDFQWKALASGLIQKRPELERLPVECSRLVAHKAFASGQTQKSVTAILMGGDPYVQQLKAKPKGQEKADSYVKSIVRSVEGELKQVKKSPEQAAQVAEKQRQKAQQAL
jgi:hypothetical protein